MAYQGDNEHGENRSRSVRSHHQANKSDRSPESTAGGIVKADRNGVTVIGPKHDITPAADQARIKQMTLALVNQARVIVELKREVERLTLVEERAFPNRRRVKQI